VRERAKKPDAGDRVALVAAFADMCCLSRKQYPFALGSLIGLRAPRVEVGVVRHGVRPSFIPS
jgi:hypothetical protein